MILLVDIGNTRTSLAFCRGDGDRFPKILERHHFPSSQDISWDPITELVERLNPSTLVIASVVPALKKKWEDLFGKTFSLLQVNTQAKTGLQLQYGDTKELGADRLAGAMGARVMFPDQGMIVCDLGTATTFGVVDREGRFLGGAILPGVRTSLESLIRGTAQLPMVELERVASKNIASLTTRGNIQSGIYWGQVGSIREFTTRLKQECFKNSELVRVIATGGNAELFAEEGLFDVVEPDLVWQGIFQFYLLNRK